LAEINSEKKWEEYLGVFNYLPIPRSWKDSRTSRNQKRAVYILTAFIEAHETAQVKILSFMGHNVGEAEHGDGGHSPPPSERAALTPEEKMVIAESKEQVLLPCG
jgi:hypothetical protein